jgi:hypothetical protein
MVLPSFFTMSHSDYASSLHLSNNGLNNGSKPVPSQSGLGLNHLPNLEQLVPQNLSNNKRAIIERLIALHHAESTH